ncbi:MAG: type II toxin-antitoxin system RelE/ParE family toxin [Gammaproteobacteria bacterium]|nr:type II toxin-antitoxin system RelE/ParE family toxin [Gammaproteobacteria bacterium]MBU1646844.1 type II toxin-antitoxin system RelE/ParE family toxin [Gammaproteobacteria bacterium]MBU1971679.1 type II toxin-antitoxin system RelE/ParE family toxin [Gammaproteobacteria bacterium]
MPVSKAQQKPLIWLGDSLESIKSFSLEARKEAGHQLGQVQVGRDPSDWKPMETVGAGVKEVRIRIEKAYRVLYVAKFAEAVYVLHGFEKKTQRTPKADIDLAGKRYRKLLNERKKK